MLTVHRAERSTGLADALARLLANPPADPFAPEVVAVPAKGVERWLTQRLAGVLGATDGDDDGDGVAANIVFPSPIRLVDDAIAAAAGSAAGSDPDDEPWASARLLWTLIDTVDGCLDEPWCAVLRAHLSGEHRITRRYATAAHLVELWRSYAGQRPQLFVDWVAGRDTDGLGAALPADLCWQAELWRRLRRHIGTPSPAERLSQACDRLRAEPGLSALPGRLSLFGPTRLSTEQLAVLDALAAHREVHLWLTHPSPAMWEALVAVAPAARRRTDDSVLAVRHPLLASLARDTRELQQRLAPLAGSAVLHPGAPRPMTLLGRVQADLAADHPPQPGAGADDTVQVHACHGPPRQVEVLREILLHLFDADPSLEPRDVLVMCPDVEAYAPLVRAAFGQGEAGGHPGHRLRVRLADRALRRTNPLLDTVAGLLELADGRVTASQVLDLAAHAPVRRLFGFGDDDLERLQTWAGAAGVRWGIRAGAQRADYGLGHVAQNTWSTGLDRVLLGVAADETELDWLDKALPLDDVASGDIDVAGRLAEFVDRLDGILTRLRGPHPARVWREHLGTALDLFTGVAVVDAWQLAEARRELAAATEHGGDTELRLADVRAMLAARLGGRPTRANFRTGELTVATLVPMRSVPHRVVVLLGLDDEVFPRGAGADGDDVLARDPAPGERDRRSEDRQLLLDAVLSAEERLIVLYTGADPVSGQPRPPAVPLGELLDVLAVTAGTDVVRPHPLQPFDPANFAAAGPFSHDRTALAGARAARGPRTAAPEFLPAPLARPGGDVELADLVAFTAHPVRALLHQRLGVRLPQEDDEVADALAAELDALGRWDVGERMLVARLRGVPAADWRQAEWRRGTLPPLRLGEQVLADVAAGVEAVVAGAASLYAVPPETHDVTVDLGGGRRLTGSVPGVRGGTVAAASYSRLGPRHRLAGWIRLLALAAGDDGPWQAVTVGRYRRDRAEGSILVPPPDPLTVLRDLVGLRDEGLCQPLPLPPAAAAAYAERRQRGDALTEAMAAAEAAYGGMYGDHTDRHLEYVFGTDGAWERIGAEPGDGTEPTRFGSLAVRLWAPLLAAEQRRTA